MKKIRIELKNKALGKPFRFFDSAEALYLWLNDVGAGPDPDGSSVVTLLPGDFLEVEWRGCEFAHEGADRYRRLDYVRFAKGSPTKNASGLVVSVDHGWVADDTFIFRDIEDELTRTRLLTSEAEWRLDLDALFQDGSDDPDEEDPDGSDVEDG